MKNLLFFFFMILIISCQKQPEKNQDLKGVIKSSDCVSEDEVLEKLQDKSASIESISSLQGGNDGGCSLGEDSLDLDL